MSRKRPNNKRGNRRQGNAADRRAQYLLDAAQRAIRTQRGADRSLSKLSREVASSIDNGDDNAIQETFSQVWSQPDMKDADEICILLELTAQGVSEAIDVEWWEPGNVIYNTVAELIVVGVFGEFGNHPDRPDADAIYRGLDESGITGNDQAIFFVPQWIRPEQLLQLSYCQRKRLLNALYGAAEKDRRQLRVPSIVSDLLAPEPVDIEARPDTETLFGLRCLVGIVVHLGSDAGLWATPEQWQRFNTTFEGNPGAGRTADHLVVSFDTYTDGIREAVESYNNMAFEMKLGRVVPSASMPCQAILEVFDDDSIVVYLQDKHGVVGEIQRGLMPWEDVDEALDGLVEILHHHGVD